MTIDEFKHKWKYEIDNEVIPLINQDSLYVNLRQLDGFKKYDVLKDLYNMGYYKGVVPGTFFKMVIYFPKIFGGVENND